jgi:hypothetical protein
MNAIENQRATAQELVFHAVQQGVQLESLRHDSFFMKDQRWVMVWRKVAGLPCTGAEEEKEGTLHYNLQGTIAVVPGQAQGTTGAFRGAWTEAGTLENFDRALALVKAWLVDQEEIDDLPQRDVSRSGIG